MIWKRIGVGFGVYLVAGIALSLVGAGLYSGLAGLGIGVFAGWTYPWGEW